MKKVVTVLLCTVTASLFFSVMRPVPAYGQTVTGQNADSPSAVSPASPSIVIHTTRVEEEIVVDGRLDEAAWSKAIPYDSRFFQQQPHDREPSSERTRVMVIQTGDTIYFGIVAYHDNPEDIFASGMRRDKDIMRGDNVELLIDTFRDKRTCYAFVTNPLGGKQDAIISDEGSDINKSWDCVWRVKAAINDDGWSAEFAIPFKSLKYKAGVNGEWGLNITRNIKYCNETTYLVPIPRGLGHSGKFKGDLYATLTGIELPSPTINLGIQPYIRGGGTWIRKPARKSDSEFDAGFDVRYHITPQIMMDATYNTDFAQIESEEEVVNVTRFNIYLPEKRDFFLENAGLFNFSMVSSAGEYYASNADFILFNSRTIGIHDGKRTPLTGGMKFAGKAGHYSIGVMNIQSEETSLDGGAVEPSTNYTAARLKREFGSRSYVGLMMLNKQPNSTDYSRTVGVDGFYSFTRELYVKGSLARTLEENDRGDDLAGDFKMQLNKDWIAATVTHTSIDSLFRPEMGFVRRDNIRKSGGSVTLTKWINNRYLRNIAWENGITYTTDHENVLDTRENSSAVTVQASSGDNVFYSFNREYEYLPGDDYIRSIMIEKGAYSTSYHRFGFGTYSGRPVSGQVNYRFGDSYDGENRTVSASGTMVLTQKFIMDLNYVYNHLDFTHGSLYANVFAGRWTYCFTTDMFAKCYLQWNDADKRVSVNVLYDYMYSPKSHLYVVYNENRDTTLGSDNVKDRLFMVKLSYFWNI